MLSDLYALVFQYIRDGERPQTSTGRNRYFFLTFCVISDTFTGLSKCLMFMAQGCAYIIKSYPRKLFLDKERVHNVMYKDIGGIY